MKWEARKIDEETWGTFLVQEFCRTDAPVCYGITKGPYAEKGASDSAARLTRSVNEESISLVGSLTIILSL